MATYKELQEEIANLRKQAEEVRTNEINSVIADIKEKMEMYGITVDDLASSKSSKKTKNKSQASAKYSDPQTGATWSGRGRQPKWLTGRNKEQYLTQ